MNGAQISVYLFSDCPYLIVVLLAPVQDEQGHQGVQADLQEEGLKVLDKQYKM